MDNLLIESETKKAGYFFKWLLGIFSCAAGIFCFMIAFRDVYPELLIITVGLIVFAIGFALIYTLDPLDRLEIYKDRLEIKSMFGKNKLTIYRDEITAWTEVESNSKNISWLELTLYTQEKKYLISGNIYKNYEPIKEELIKGKERDVEIEIQIRKKRAKTLAALFISVGIIFLFIFFYQFMSKNKALTPADITTLKEVITSDVRITKGSKGSRSICLDLMHYPDFNFEINNTTFKATAADDFVANVRTGDTIEVEIATDEYQMKLTKEKELGFFDKTVNYRTIAIYGLRDKNRAYLLLAGYNTVKFSIKDFRFWMMGIFGLIALGAGVFFLRTGTRR